MARKLITRPWHATFVLITLLILSCSKRPDSRGATNSASSPTPTSTALAATPSEQHRLAPPGVLYLLEYVSLKTSGGVTGFPPGTRVRFVEDKGETIVVINGKIKLEVDQDKLTNDLDIAALAANQDAEGQQQLADYLAGQRAIDEALRGGQNAAYDHDQREIAAQRAARAAASSYSNPLARGPYHERGSLSRRRWIYNPEYPESRSPPSDVIITQPQ